MPEKLPQQPEPLDGVLKATTRLALPYLQLFKVKRGLHKSTTLSGRFELRNEDLMFTAAVFSHSLLGKLVYPHSRPAHRFDITVIERENGRTQCRPYRHYTFKAGSGDGLKVSHHLDFDGDGEKIRTLGIDYESLRALEEEGALGLDRATTADELLLRRNLEELRRNIKRRIYESFD